MVALLEDGLECPLSGSILWCKIVGSLTYQAQKLSSISNLNYPRGLFSRSAAPSIYKGSIIISCHCLSDQLMLYTGCLWIALLAVLTQECTLSGIWKMVIVIIAIDTLDYHSMLSTY